MKKFETPKLEIEIFKLVDVITTSPEVETQPEETLAPETGDNDGHWA